MTEHDALVTLAILLGVMIVIGAILPAIAPGLVRLLDETVLKGERTAKH